MPEQTVKCPICGEPYVFYSHYAGDQSACPACRTKARGRITPTDKTNGKWTS
jgi:ribosomal protein S27E